jgi:hypothetical protein
MRLFATLLLASCLLVASAAGRDIFVSNVAGDDRQTGERTENLTDITGPVRTIAKALRLAQPGDRIVLANTGEPYRESVSLVGRRHSGFVKQPFMIQGNGATLDGSAPVPREGWKHYRDAVFCFRPPHTGYQQLFLDGRPAVRVAVSQMAGSPPKLEPRQWCLHEGNIYFCVEQTKLPDDYKPAYARLPTGITLYQVQYVGIQDLTIQGFQLDGINAQNSAQQVYLTGVTSRGNGRCGIVVGGASQVDLQQCAASQNITAQLLTQANSETHIRACDLPRDTAPGWVDEGGRVYLGKQRIAGGREAIKPDEGGASADAPAKPAADAREPGSK